MDEKFVKEYFKKPRTVSRWWNPEEEGSHSERRFHREYKEYVVSRIGKGSLVFDCGVGKGRLISQLRENQVECVGMDISLEMIRICMEKTNLREVVVGDIEAIPLKGGVFDHSVSLATFEHIPNPQSALRELSRITKKDGEVIASFSEYSLMREAAGLVNTLGKIPFSSRERRKIKDFLKVLLSGVYDDVRGLRLVRYYKKNEVEELIRNSFLAMTESKRFSSTRFPGYLLVVGKKIQAAPPNT